MTNFWYFILMAGQFLMNNVVIPLFGGLGAYHQAMGFKDQLGAGVYVVLEVAWATLGNFDLTLPAICLKLFFPLWLIRTGVGVWMTIKRIIPFIG